MLFLLAVAFGVQLASYSSVRGDEPASAGQPELKVRMSAGGIGRHGANRWGMTRAVATNRGTETQSALIVVTPPGSQGLQYARKFDIPAKSTLETSWPIRLGTTEAAASDFAYLVYPNGTEDGLIHRNAHDEFIPTYSGVVNTNQLMGLTGIVFDVDDSAEQTDSTTHLLKIMTSWRHQKPNVITVKPADLSVHGECLDPLDQLTVTSSDLMDYPDGLESIRAWLQRGGYLWIRLDRTGLDVARAMLDDALPLSVVGETTANTVVLTLNPEYRQSMYPTREVERNFDEPIRYVRVVQDGGDAMWSIDGWPVAIRIPVGRGTVVVTTVDPSVFFVNTTNRQDNQPEHQLIPSAEIIQQTLFANRWKPTLRKDEVTEQAASIIGYGIPSQTTAIGLTLCFPVLLLSFGMWLQRREKGERLIFFLPALATLVAIPAIGMGSLGRSVAPKTVIETAIVHAVPGAKRLVSDGYASVFDVGTETLEISGIDGAIVEVDGDSTNLNYRQLVWTGTDRSHWRNLDQPDGIQTFVERSIETLDHPLSAIATFDENGIVGRLNSGGLSETGDLIIAGTNPERMSLKLESDGRFRGTQKEVLVAGNFMGSMFVNDQQRRRAEVYAAVFDPEGHDLAFPQTLSLFFWAQSKRQVLNIGDSAARHERSLLISHPLRLERPDVGAPIVIPSPFIYYRSTTDSQGMGLSAIYDNGKRLWTTTERSTQSFLEFQVPSVCLPFEAESAELELTIRAGSRTLSVSAGDFESQSVVSTLQSPLGNQSITIPVDLIRETCRSGKFYVSLAVSDLDESLHDETASETQNDYWEISRLGITLSGKRTTDVP